jgi:magnesium chelatase family protein
MEMGVISARGYGRVLRLAWTVADVDGKDVPSEGEVNTAIELRRGERV